MKALNKTLQPVVHLGVQVGVGAGPVFEPSITPVFALDRKGDDDEDGDGAGRDRRRRR